jgi:hypothetical protein
MVYHDGEPYQRRRHIPIWSSDRKAPGSSLCCGQHNDSPDSGIWCDRDSFCCGRCPSREHPRCHGGDPTDALAGM